MIPFPYEILEGATLKGESPYWLVTYQGFQLGGDIDSSGAGNLTFSSYDEAFDYISGFASNDTGSYEFDITAGN